MLFRLGTAILAALSLCFTGSAAGQIFGSVLPTSRAGGVDSALTVFASMINASAVTKFACEVQLGNTAPAVTLTYQATDATNVPVSSVNTPVSVGAGAAQAFIITLTPLATFNATEAPIVFACDSDNSPTTVGLTTVMVTSSITPGADVIALSAVPDNNGILTIAGGVSAFSVATINVGAAGNVRVEPTLSPALASLASGTLCETSASGACLSEIGASKTIAMTAGGVHTFAIFVGTAANTIPLDPARYRVGVQIIEDSDIVGRSSVAVKTPPAGGYGGSWGGSWQSSVLTNVRGTMALTLSEGDDSDSGDVSISGLLTMFGLPDAVGVSVTGSARTGGTFSLVGTTPTLGCPISLQASDHVSPTQISSQTGSATWRYGTGSPSCRTSNGRFLLIKSSP